MGKFERVVSHSQLSMYESCPLKWKLRYVDKHKDDTPSIFANLGTALHELGQDFLQGKLVKEQLFNEMPKYVAKQCKDADGKVLFSKDEIRDMLGKASTLLLNETFYPVKGYKLKDVEYKLHEQVLPTHKVYMTGYIDLLWESDTGDEFYIRDFKFTNNGWNRWTKRDELKIGQVNLYKWYLHKKLNVPLKKIHTGYDIYRFNIPDWDDFNDRHYSTFKPKQTNKACEEMAVKMERFVESCFNEDGSFKTDRIWHPLKSGCKYCPYVDRHDLCPPEKRL